MVETALPAFATEFPMESAAGPVGVATLAVIVGVLLLGAGLAILLARRRGSWRATPGR